MITELENFYDVDFEPYVLSNNFPFFYQDSTTSKTFPCLAHTLIPRYNLSDPMPVSSPHWYDFEPIFQKFIKLQNIKLDKICRASINLTTNFMGYKHNEPHIDHTFPHKNFLYYVNSFDDGNTFIFNKKFDGNNTVITDAEILCEIKSTKNKAICFDGLNYHAQGFCKPNQFRCVLVVTFTEIP